MREDVQSTSCLHAHARPCDYQVELVFFPSNYVTRSYFASRLNTIQLISVWSVSCQNWSRWWTTVRRRRRINGEHRQEQQGQNREIRIENYDDDDYLANIHTYMTWCLRKSLLVWYLWYLASSCYVGHGCSCTFALFEWWATKNIIDAKLNKKTCMFRSSCIRTNTWMQILRMCFVSSGKKQLDRWW